MDNNYSGNEKLLTTGQAAKLLGINRTSMWYAWDKKKIQAALLIPSANGLRPLFTEEAVLAYGASRRRGRAA